MILQVKELLTKDENILFRKRENK